MGNLTDDMTRLRGKVDSLRRVRGAMMQDLTDGARDLTAAVAAMRADFTFAHAAMAKQTRGERDIFVGAMIDEVNSLLSVFFNARNDAARRGRHDREVFLSNVKKQVMGMCKETADDLMGARLAWRSRSPGPSPCIQSKKEPVLVKPMVSHVEVSEIKAENSSAPFKRSLKKEKKEIVTAPEPPAVKNIKVKVLPSVLAPMPLQKNKESHWPDEKPAKKMTKVKKSGK
jgi:hypothetical protein